MDYWIFIIKKRSDHTWFKVIMNDRRVDAIEVTKHIKHLNNNASRLLSYVRHEV